MRRIGLVWFGSAVVIGFVYWKMFGGDPRDPR
jgi:hypothetical protein